MSAVRVFWLAGLGGLVALGGAAGALAAQAAGIALGGSAAALRVHSEGPAGASDVSGTAFGGDGQLRVGRFQLAGSYLQGTLRPGAGAAFSRTVVEGNALLGIRALDWLTLRGGLRARAYVLTGGTQRWLLWTVGARAERAFVGSAVTGYVELWRAVSADVNLPQPLDYAQGGEVGMVARLARLPLQARLAYRIDHAVLDAASGRQTVDGLALTVLLGRR